MRELRIQANVMRRKRRVLWNMRTSRAGLSGGVRVNKIGEVGQPSRREHGDSRRTNR